MQIFSVVGTAVLLLHLLEGMAEEMFGIYHQFALASDNFEDADYDFYKGLYQGWIWFGTLIFQDRILPYLPTCALLCSGDSSLRPTS